MDKIFDNFLRDTLGLSLYEGIGITLLFYIVIRTLIDAVPFFLVIKFFLMVTFLLILLKIFFYDAFGNDDKK